jgi:hypothetical protein
MHSEGMSWHRVALAVVATLSLTGCGGDATDAVEPTGESEPAILTTSPGWSFWPQAAVSGDLTVDAGCLLVGEYLAIWPPGTAWDASTEAVTFAGAGSSSNVLSVGIGEWFDGGGGSLSDRVYQDELGAEDLAAMERCLADTDAEGTVFAYLSD